MEKILLVLLLGSAVTLSGCNQLAGGTTSEEESAAAIANRAEEIEAAADASVNRQIAEIEAEANASLEAEPVNGRQTP
jgi:hypothetical protein